jgi:hypothetical protein
MLREWCAQLITSPPPSTDDIWRRLTAPVLELDGNDDTATTAPVFDARLFGERHTVTARAALVNVQSGNMQLRSVDIITCTARTYGVCTGVRVCMSWYNHESSQHVPRARASRMCTRVCGRALPSSHLVIPPGDWGANSLSHMRDTGSC